MKKDGMDIFGKVQMGYSIIESNRLDAWQRFLGEGFGMHEVRSDSSALVYRMDAHERRLMVVPGTAEDFTTLGLQVQDEATLQVILDRLQTRGIVFNEGSTADADSRGVEGFWRFTGPKGLLIELYTQARMSDEPLEMKTSAFLTGEGGMGHVAITSKQPELMGSFWREIFDARVSDTIEQKIDGVTLDITFYRFNERHHSIAVAATRGLRLDPIRTRIQHMNFQVATVDDLTNAFMRCRELGFEMAHEMGQHPNDGELSFYAYTPSGFEMELGWNPLVVDETNWDIGHYEGMSSWGHKPENPNPLHNLGNFKNGVASLFRSEYSPITEEKSNVQ